MLKVLPSPPQVTNAPRPRVTHCPQVPALGAAAAGGGQLRAAGGTRPGCAGTGLQCTVLEQCICCCWPQLGPACRLRAAISCLLQRTSATRWACVLLAVQRSLPWSIGAEPYARSCILACACSGEAGRTLLWITACKDYPRLPESTQVNARRTSVLVPLGGGRRTAAPFDTTTE